MSAMPDNIVGEGSGTRGAQRCDALAWSDGVGGGGVILASSPASDAAQFVPTLTLTSGRQCAALDANVCMPMIAATSTATATHQRVRPRTTAESVVPFIDKSMN